MFGLFRKHETDDQIRERLLKLCKEGDYGFCPPPMDINVAFEELKNFFLGEDWYVNMPLSNEQVIAKIVYQIETNCKELKQH